MKTLVYLEDVNETLQVVYNAINDLADALDDNDRYQSGFKHGLLTVESAMIDEVANLKNRIVENLWTN